MTASFSSFRFRQARFDDEDYPEPFFDDEDDDDSEDFYDSPAHEHEYENAREEIYGNGDDDSGIALEQEAELLRRSIAEEQSEINRLERRLQQLVPGTAAYAAVITALAAAHNRLYVSAAAQKNLRGIAAGMQPSFFNQTGSSRMDYSRPSSGHHRKSRRSAPSRGFAILLLLFLLMLIAAVIILLVS